MGKREADQLIRQIKQHREAVKADRSEAARALQRAGLITKALKPTKPYADGNGQKKSSR